MKRTTLCAVLGGLPVLATVAGPAAAAELDMNAKWKNGLALATEDGSTQIKLGIQAQNDWVFQSGEDDVLAAIGDELEDGTRFRRVRLATSGTIEKVGVFKLQLDFAGGKVVLKDAYAGIAGIPGLGTVTVGDQYEPFGMETLSSSKHLTFVERSLPDAMAPERNSGIVATNHGETVTWAAGVFRDSDGTGFSAGDGEYNGTARLVVRPQNEDGGKRLVHLGAAGSLRNPAGDEVGFDMGAENPMSPDYVDTGDLAADGVKLFGLEAATLQGPLSLQGEYVQANVTTLDNEDPVFASFYLSASWVLTGESRSYKAADATLGGVKPDRPYDGEGAPGAWEVAARYSRGDLDDQSVAGGDLRDVTLALNWYPNANLRWMLNYIRADLQDVGTTDALATRFQVAF